MLHLQRGQPAQVGSSPRGLAGVGDAVAQQQRLQTVARVALLAHAVFARSHEVAHSFVGRTRHANDSQVVGARQARKLHRIASVGLDALARRPRDRGRGDHIALPSLGGEVTLQHEAARAGLIDDVQPRVPCADEFAHRLGHRHDTTGHRAQVTNLGVARRVGYRNVDAVLVNVQTDVQSDRFLHGPSPGEFALHRPTIDRLQWCSSARPRRATYVVA